MQIINRRKFLGATAGMAGMAGLTASMPAWARGASGGTLARKGSDVLSGEKMTMTVADAVLQSGQRRGPAITVNGTIPGPLLRLKEGQNLVVDLFNESAMESSIHWHGLLVPFQMDGVPGVTMAALKQGERFRYEFPIRQSGTYWWHAHTLQEPMGHYGPIIIDPAGGEVYSYDRDYVVVLSDWSPMDPFTVLRKMKVGGAYFNYAQRSMTDEYPLSAEERLMWARMRMAPTDISDAGASGFEFLMNGHGYTDGLEFLFRPGEKVRLRFINAAAMTFFNVRIPGLSMKVIQADGQNIEPVEVDEFQMGNAETYDVIVEPRGAEAFAIVAETMERSGMAVAMLAIRPGARAAIPALRDPPLLTMADMGMSMTEASGAAAGGMAGMAGMAVGKGEMDMTAKLPLSFKVGPGVTMIAMNPVDRMGDPGIGLDAVDHRVLDYRKLKSAKPHANPRRATRMKEIHLTGNMDRYMWSFDGKKYSAVTDDPIRFAFDERVRVKLINNTMMAHPIHLHGHFFELVNGTAPDRQPLKHTVIVQPGSSAQFDLTANEPGDWAFHCHLLYHMQAGMFQVVTVRPLDGGAA